MIDRPMYHVEGFGRDCLGNISGYQVVRYNEGFAKIEGKFFGDLYQKGSFEIAKAEATKLAAKLSAE